MADTTFATGTTITKEWLQDINDFVYDFSLEVTASPFRSHEYRQM